MPAVVNTPDNVQRPSKLKKARDILLAPVRWLVIGLAIALLIAFTVLVLVLILKLYSLAGGKMPGWLGQRAEAFMEAARIPQTTHDTDVNNAISINIQKLRENYGELDVEDGFTQEIENFINELECIANGAQKAADKDQLTEDEKKHALECLKRIKNNSDLNSGSKLTLKQVLSLVWRACNDENKKSADRNININIRILQRKYQLVKHLVESQTEYGVRGGNACFTGTFNSIVSSLYTFEEFNFLQKANKDTIKQEFENELQKKGEELFNQLSNDKEKKEVAEALSNPSTNFFISFIESFKNHSARAVLGDKEYNELVKTHLSNLQYNETISRFT
ncbi:membrane protein WF-2 like-protein [Wolbachia endosymbiont of Armadillidium vulgare str. wVulC]|uniref:hypothetical protein n=1 Tax=Wolbachia endosymbiont of Armadillidium vulgare TaxID=77039 RepID=UPI00064B1E9A|nr:hypothetical protein [Wolbachia endosymbiont of Armadillidium vulgare]KLT22826.1 membrane protein WF-2 like-protein [Wolbachia endosymbiont of Armadillidium vulgare str. wVulC]